MVTLELIVAMGLLIGAMLPLAYSFAQEQRLARVYYYRAVAIEIVDGEMESLMAGAWRSFPKGQQKFQTRAESVKNLPAGEFLLTIDERQLQLEWRPAKFNQGGVIKRSAALPVAAALREGVK